MSVIDSSCEVIGSNSSCEIIESSSSGEINTSGLEIVPETPSGSPYPASYKPSIGPRDSQIGAASTPVKQRSFASISDNSSPITRKKSGGPKPLNSTSRVEVSSFQSTYNGSSSSSLAKSPHASLITQKKQKEEKILQLSSEIKKLEATARTVKLSALPDGGHQLRASLEKKEKELLRHSQEMREIEERLSQIGSIEEISSDDSGPKPDKWELVKMPQTALNLNEMGKKALQTHQTQQALTIDTLNSMHKALKNRPTDSESFTVVGLKVDLLPHQKEAMSWLLWRENETPKGGILADDMGLGKTLTMISLILKQKELKDKDDEDLPRGFVRGGTLVVCPATLMDQWEKEIKERVVRNMLIVTKHHGPKRDVKPHRLSVYDVVITSYGIVQKESSETSPGALHRVKWDRIILDEGHTIRNHKSITAKAVTELSGRKRWVLTGTPIHNKALDYYSLLKFLRCKPFDDFLVWKRWVENKSIEGQKRLACLTEALLLRRTKEDVQKRGELKDLLPKKFHVVEVKLDDMENSLYEKVAHFSSSLLAQLIQQRAEKDELLKGGLVFNKRGHPDFGNNEILQKNPDLARLYKDMVSMGNIKSHDILVLLLRLRQICCHPHLSSGILNKIDLCGEAVEEDGLEADLFDKLLNLTITDNEKEGEEPSAEETISVLKKNSPVFRKDRPSSKLRAIIQCIKDNIIGTDDKAIIVSQWSSALGIIEQYLKKEKVWCSSITGSIPVKDRAPIIEKFNKDPLSQQVMLVSLNAGGTGLNLVGANHLLLVDVHWNPQLEAQACDRIYRVGQRKQVHVYKFVCMGTIEEKIVDLQKKKLELADAIVSGGKHRAGSALSFEDLKMLFGLH